jgi:LacI family transcriptional regulator
MILSHEKAFSKANTQLQEMVQFAVQAAKTGDRIDLVERELFWRLLAIGLSVLQGFVAAQGSGDEGLCIEREIARASPELQRRLAKLGIPLVNVWYQHARPTLPGVYPDMAAIARGIADHLIDRGFRRLAFFGVKKYRRDHELGMAFEAAAAERGCTCVCVDCGNPEFGDRTNWLALQRSVENVLDTLERPLGIFAVTAVVARLVMTMCQEREPRGTRTVGVACLDNVKTIVELPPQITSIDSNYFRLGQVAAELLDQLMSGESPPMTTRFIPSKGVVPRESTDYFGATDEVVLAALEYISKRLRKHLSLDEIAGAVSVSPRSLQRRFEAAMGCGVSDEIRRLRIDLARRLLGEGKLTIDQIAREAGFSSAVTMNHAFHRDIGMSPTAYHKQARGT